MAAAVDPARRLELGDALGGVDAAEAPLPAPDRGRQRVGEGILAQLGLEERARGRLELRGGHRPPVRPVPQRSLAAVDQPEQPRRVERRHVELPVLPVGAVARARSVDLQRAEPEVAQIRVERGDRAEAVQADDQRARRLVARPREHRVDPAPDGRGARRAQARPGTPRVVQAAAQVQAAAVHLAHHLVGDHDLEQRRGVGGHEVVRRARAPTHQVGPAALGSVEAGLPPAGETDGGRAPVRVEGDDLPVAISPKSVH